MHTTLSSDDIIDYSNTYDVIMLLGLTIKVGTLFDVVSN